MELAFDNMGQVDAFYTVPEFPFEGFRPILGVKADLEKVIYPVYADPKFDGVRVLIYNGYAYSRMLKPIPNRSLQAAAKDLPYGYIFDGEVVSGDFEQSDSFCMSVNGKQQFRYHIFDMLTLDRSFILYDIPFDVRKRNLKEVFDKAGKYIPFTRLISSIVINNEQDLLELHEKMVTFGYEGTMIRDPEGYYKFGRSTVNQGLLLKIKNFHDDEAIILEFQEKFTNENLQEFDNLGYSVRSKVRDNLVQAETLGALIVKNSEGEVFKVGTGFTDKQRDEIWFNRDNLKGKIIVYKYQGKTGNNKPRFPVFKGFRSKEL